MRSIGHRSARSGDRCRSDKLKQLMEDKLVAEAERQLRAVAGTDPTVEWRVVDEEMALRIGSILDERLGTLEQRSRITVIFTPASDIVR